MEGEETPTDGRELLELDVHEVSLVDRGAVRRKFSVVKRETIETEVEKSNVSPSQNGDGKGAGGISNSDRQGVYDQSASGYPKAKKEPAAMGKARTKVAKEDATAIEGEITTVEKDAAAPLLTALAGERLSLISQKITEIKTGIGATGTMTKQEACTAFWDLSDLCWRAQTDVVSVAKSLGIEAPVTEHIEKAWPKKMTKRRKAMLKKSIDDLSSLHAELESETETDDDTEDTTMNEAEMTAAVQKVTDAVTKTLDATITTAVEKGVTPLAAKIEEVEKKLTAAPAAPAATTTAVEKAEDAAAPAPEWAKGLQKSLDGLGSRLSALEAGSNAQPVDPKTAVPVKKAEGDIWGNTLGL